MRKRITGRSPDERHAPHDNWLPLEKIADVEVTSESPEHPIEAALFPGIAEGWRAAGPGTQTIRLIFERPQPVRRIWLSFIEPDFERTQEYVIRWSPNAGRSFHEIVRQQWNFSPRGATSETEDHHVDLAVVSVLELTIIPDQRQGSIAASLAQLRLA